MNGWPEARAANAKLTGSQRKLPAPCEGARPTIDNERRGAGLSPAFSLWGKELALPDATGWGNPSTAGPTARPAENRRRCVWLTVPRERTLFCAFWLQVRTFLRGMNSGDRGVVPEYAHMERLEALQQADIAAPTPELCLIAGLIIHLTQGKPRQVERLVGGMRAFTNAQKELHGVIRLRGAKFDTDVLDSMSKAAVWLERMEPFLLMMARR